MKFAIVIASMFMAFGASASEIRFKCEMNTDIHYQNQFSLEGKAITDGAKTFENVEFDFTVRKAGFNSQNERLVVTRDGEVKYFEAGTYHNTKRSIGLISAVKGDAVEAIQLFVDFAGAFHSKIRLLDGTTYYSTCKSL